MDIEWLRNFCLALPAVTEDVKWDNDLCFCIDGKMFCVTALEGAFKCSFKVRDEEFEELLLLDGIVPAPYMARNKWVQVQVPSALDRAAWKSCIKQSYELIKSKLTKKRRSELGLA